MPGTIEIQDLIETLSRGRATFVAQVGAGSTTTTINLTGLNLGTANLAGNLVLLDAGALGAGSAETVASITANTATTLTVPALSAAPNAGANLWIFAIATIEAELVVSLDAEGTPGQAAPSKALQVGGSDGTDLWALATDSSGRAKVVDDQAQGSTGTVVPAQSLQVAGSDGANLRTLATDTLGRLVTQPQALVWDAAGLAVAAGTNVFAVSYTPPGAGVLTITIGNLSTGAASVADLVKTANSAPSGGSAGTRIFALNSGNPLAAGTIETFQVSVTPNDQYNLQFVTATSVDITATFKAD